MSKLTASRGWVCAFCITPIVIVAAALLVLAPSGYRRAPGRASAASSASFSLPGADTAASSRIQASYAALPLAFEQNQGQTDAQVKYLARGSGYTLFLTANDAVFSLHSRHAATESTAHEIQSHGKNRQVAAVNDSTAVVRMHLTGGNSLAKVEGSDALPGTSNYFLGNDRSKWRTGVPQYARVAYRDVYPGVNMAFHGAERQLEFDFVVAAGANPAPIGFQFSGNQGMKTDDSGNLIVSSSAGDVFLHKPVAYQDQNGVRQPVDAQFVLKADNKVSFELGEYDRQRELVIDPTVTYSTYLGGTSNDSGYGIAFDSSGNAYVTGQTASANFPGFTSTNKLTGTANVFVTKLKADGSALVYSTYVGGTHSDSGNGIALDASGNAFVAGGTSSIDFPVTNGSTYGSGAITNAFIAEIGTSGTLSYATFLGGTGTDVALGIALDPATGTYAVVGSTSSVTFPIKNATAIQTTLAGTSNGFVTLWNSSNTQDYYTYLGRTTGEVANAVALDSSDNAYVTGKTSSPTFPTKNPSQPKCGTDGTCNGGLSDAFVTVIKADASGYIYSTFLGGSSPDQGNGIAVDSLGNAYVTGATASADFPLNSALQKTYGGNTDAFVTKFNATSGTVAYSTYLGGGSFDAGAGIAIDASGTAYVTGQTDSASPTPFPTASPTQASLAGGFDAFVSEIGPGGSALVFSTYLGGSLNEDVGGDYGGIAVDSAGANIYVTGSTGSTSDFPTTTGSVQPTSGGATDAFVVKYKQAATSSPTFSLSATALSPATVSPGGSATSTVTVTPANGFSGSVTLTCAVSPAVSLAPTCSGSASTGTPGTLTVSTTPASALLQHQDGHSSAIFYAMFLPMGGIALLGFGSAGARRRKLFGGALLCLVLGGLLLLPACGGGSSTKPTGSSGTPANTYTITVSGTASGATQTGTPPSLTLVVN